MDKESQALLIALVGQLLGMTKERHNKTAVRVGREIIQLVEATSPPNPPMETI